MSDEDATGELRNVDRARKCVVCVICCPFNCAFECAEEVRDTIIYFALCPQRCLEERKKKKEARRIRHASPTYRKKTLKEKCTPPEDCYREPGTGKRLCLYISCVNWGT